MGPAAAIPLIAAGVNVASSVFGAVSAGKQRRRALNEERRARKEMDRLKSIYANLDTSNPYINMENTMEDLTINQQQAQFQAEQIASQQANTLDALRSAAGGSGVAALAQTLAQQGQLAAQRASASIGQQEATNQRLAAQQAGRNQILERQGEVISRNLRRDQVGTLLGMSQQETAAARQQAALAQRAKLQAIFGGISGATSAISAGLQSGAFENNQSQSLNTPVTLQSTPVSPITVPETTMGLQTSSFYNTPIPSSYNDYVSVIPPANILYDPQVPTETIINYNQ